MTLTENLIKASLKTAKWNNELARMKQAAKAIDYYNYRQIDDTKAAISLQFPESQNELIPYIRTYPYTEQIIDDMSLIFKKPATMTCNKDNTAVQELFITELVEKPKLNAYLLMLNRYVNLLDKVGMLVRWYENGKQIEYVFITPDKCFVIQDPDSPSHAVAVCYKTDEQVDTYNATNKNNRWIMIDNDYITKIEIDSQSGNYKIIGTPEPNQYGFIPIVWFSNTISTDGFWIDKGNPIVEINEDYNVLMTVQKLGIIYQEFATLVTIGLSDKTTLKAGARAWVDIPSSMPGDQPGDAKYITPNNNIEACDKLHNNVIDRLATYAGLSTAAFRKDTASFLSGYALKLSKSDVIEANETEKQLYTPAVKQLLEYAIKIYSYHSDKTLESVTEIGIDYQPITVDINPIEQANLRTMNKMLGIADRLTWVKEDNPDLTDEQAQQYLDDLDMRNMTINLDSLVENAKQI